VQPRSVHSALAKCLQLTERFRSTTTPFDIVRAKDALNLYNALNALLVTFCKLWVGRRLLLKGFVSEEPLCNSVRCRELGRFRQARHGSRTARTRHGKLYSFMFLTRWSPSLVIKFRIKRRAAQRGVDSASGFAGSRNVRTRRGHR
jgi:hypothetical protein